MTEIGIQPLVNWPRQVTPGRSYLITVDLRLTDPNAPWPYDEEEFVVGCMLDGRPTCTVRALGDAGVVLHRFGGSYGPARFLAEIPAERTDFTDAALWLTLTTAGGVPFYTGKLPLDGLSVPEPVDASAETGTEVQIEPSTRSGTGLVVDGTIFEVLVGSKPIGSRRPVEPADAKLLTRLADSDLSQFRDRYMEFDEVLNDLIREDGEHFWLVLAPPKLGKSWFINLIGKTISSRYPGRWAVRLLDIRDQPAHILTDTEALLGIMFNFENRPATDLSDPRELAITFLNTNRSYLFLLDSAELLGDSTIRALRSYLSTINRYLGEAKNASVRLALIVASRRDKGWLNIAPSPRLRLLKLTSFKIEVIYEALSLLSERIGSDFSSAELMQHARLVHHMSEGLPALLDRYLDWISEQRFIDLQRLEKKALFDQLAKPYIEHELISRSGLSSSGIASTSEQQLALQLALQVLVRYRILTVSHLRHHVAPGSPLSDVLQTLSWSVEELWDAISRTDLVARPQRELWQEIDTPIRRLLCRYWYSSPAHLSDAHSDALQFVRALATGQMGSEQPVFLVECLWHEAQVLSLSGSSDAEEKLTELARTLSSDLAPSFVFSQDDLRQDAVARMIDDQELMESVEDLGASLDRLVNAVLRPDIGTSP